MQTPLEIAFRHVAPTAEINAVIGDKVRHMKTFHDGITGFHAYVHAPQKGKVDEIHHDRDFGQIIATDNRLIYVDCNSVVDGHFAQLQPRDTVELVVPTRQSDIGPQASTVRCISNLAYDPATKPSRR
ncbi:hypothetical protein [Yoonia sp.]|uniref:hypothetical protein n=1 Tax=Yoonia sp. TaxID=2212373 RepID=UPI003F6C66B9